MKKLKGFLHDYRFEAFLITLVFILFGSLIFPSQLFEVHLFPVFFLLNIIAGINLISKKKIRFLFGVLFFIGAIIFGTSLISKAQEVDYIRFALYFLFYVVMAYEIITQVWYAKKINKDLIIGIVCGYITLGLVGFFIFMAVEMANPGSFGGALFAEDNLLQNSDTLLYYSYITLMTIGYGEIVPLTAIAQKAAILLGLMGQFYLVIITAIVVGKVINKKYKN